MAAKSFDEVDFVSTADQRSEAEERWVSFQPYLLSKGYRLRTRYQPNWVPSWKGSDIDPTNCEDSVDSMPLRVLDATRVVDGRQVIIKMLVPAQTGREGLEELDLLQHFSSPKLKDDPANHVVPCLDSFPIPGIHHGYFVVMPLLGKYKYPPFYNLVEVHDFLRQLFEGLSYMHNNNVAHCDIASANVMMDVGVLYNEPFHPYHRRFSVDLKRRIYPEYIRSQKRVRYYYIDLGYAKWFKNTDVPRLIPADHARVMAPEQQLNRPYDPFRADIFQLGAIIRRDLLKELPHLHFLLPLARSMTERDPANRPHLEKAHATMNSTFVGLSGWSYRRPIIPQDASFKNRLQLVVIGIMAEFQYWLGKALRLLLLRH